MDSLNVLLWAIICGAGAWRIHRLLGQDKISHSIRERLPDGLIYWLECPHCSGSWYAIALTYLAWTQVGFPYPILVGLAAMATTSILGERV